MSSSKLSRIESNQEKDLDSIKTNRKNIGKNYDDISQLLDRVKRLESILESTLKTKSDVKSRPKAKPVQKKGNTVVDSKTNQMDMDKKRAEQLQLDRSALIKFNKMNDNLPEKERYIWKRVIEKDGEPSIETFDRIFDNKSLESLLSNAVTKAIVDDILVGEGGPKLNIGTSIRKKYWVFLKNGKLTTLSRDFMDGVGSEYLWTEDSSLKPPSTQWRLATKREKDPRRRHIDPRTKALWVPDDERIPVVANPEKQNDDGNSSSSSSSSSDSSDDSSSDSSSDSSDDSSNDESDADAGHDEKVVNRDTAKNEEKAVDCNDDNDAKKDNDNNVPEDKNDIDESGGADDDHAGDEVVERDDGGNVSDLGDVVRLCVDSVGVNDDVSSGRVDVDDAGSIPLVGTKRPVEEYGNTSSDDSDSDDEKENVPPKMARVL